MSGGVWWGSTPSHGGGGRRSLPPVAPEEPLVLDDGRRPSFSNVSAGGSPVGSHGLTRNEANCLASHLPDKRSKVVFRQGGALPNAMWHNKVCISSTLRVLWQKTVCS